MKKRAFTLLEMIFVIAISAILAIGAFKAFEALYIRSARAKAVTDMTLRSQIILDQIGVLLYNRVPNSVIGYTPSSDCEAITELTTSRPVLEWLSTMDDELINREYDGFIDMGDSNKTSHVLSVPNISKDFTDVNLVFAGAFDEGAEETNKACEGAFGWHGNDSNLSYDISIDSANNEITLTDSNESQPSYIYEKFYLTKTAYAIARGADLLQSDVENNCGYDTSNLRDFNTTLFLFYNYQPFAGETFCGDSSGTTEGNVSVLGEDISSFEAIYINDSIRINIDMNKTIRGSQSDVHIYKQKVIF